LRVLPSIVNRGLQRSSFKTHCVNGHEFTSENTRIRAGGGRDCRACALSRRNNHGTHCPNGHELNQANTYIHKLGGRFCRACNREAARRYAARKAAG
jgi:hypothetical protein